MASVGELGRLPEVDEWGRTPPPRSRSSGHSSAPSLSCAASRARRNGRRSGGAGEKTSSSTWHSPASGAGRRWGSCPRLCSATCAPSSEPTQKACTQADQLLFQAGDASAIDAALQAFIGPVSSCPTISTPTAAPWIPLSRCCAIYEGCGRAYLGEVEGVNVIKIHRRSGKLSYLSYPAFDSDPHPALLRCIRLNLRTRQLDCTDYSKSENPPVLHRKETFPARRPSAL